ncbi:DUF3990 domain-containing protein [Muribaculum intestinale]|uniref:DUF3990 domain-containing protein n=1 Tax=Muribaculum intestinale TaxID=1796646 RepID=UPI0025A96372|nr:DUF3990 domain-containing protein [Muribaculum intestinale]
MILYHGSNISIKQIDLNKSKPNKDFGRGFYLSEDETQAQKMAVFKSMQLGGEPVVTGFMFNEEIMNASILNIRIFHDYSEDWADFVFSNREGKPVEQYDIVYGPIADDKIGLQIRKLKDGSIDKTEFLNRLKYMKGITYQYYFGTEAAVKYLTKI